MKVFLSMVMVTLAVFAGWLVYQQSVRQKEAPRPTAVAVIPSVEVTRVETRTLQDRSELVGRLEAVSEVEIHTRTSGYITNVPYGIGDPVEKGKVIVELDDSSAQELVARAQAALTVAEAQVLTQKAKMELAEKEIRRHRDLSRMGVATPQQLEAAEAELAVSRSQVELEKAHVQQAQADLLRSKLTLEESRVVAPMSGFVAERLAEVGDLAQPDKPILKIVRLDTVRTVVHVAEKEYEKVIAGQLADIQVEAFPNRIFHGKVVRKAPVLEPETRTAAVHIDIPNDRVLLRPGMHARASLTFRRQQAERVISVDALLERENRSQVFVVRGTPPTLHLLDVIPGIVDGPFVEIVSGLALADRVVTLGGRLVKEGQEVKTIEVPLQAGVRSEGESAVQTARAPVGG